MAIRENQGMQIALILLVMVTVLLAVTTFIFFSQASEKAEQVAAAEKKVQQANTATRTIQKENEQLNGILGYTIEDEWKVVEEHYKNDMLKFAQEFPPDQRNYRELVGFLMDELRKKHDELSNANDQTKRVTAERDSIRTREQAKAEAAAKGQEKLAEDLKAERDKFNQQIAGNNKQREDLAKQKDTAVATLSSVTKQKDERISILLGETDQLKKVVQRKQDIIEGLENVSPENPDGRISRVSQRNRTVYINVGWVDDLKRQTTFSVYDENVGNVEEAKPKASIEVIAIVGPHLAEARIFDDDLSDPILRGDQIYTPLWNPGRHVHFALGGFMDIDGDGKSDRTLIRNLITLSGGVIDAELHDDGRLVGKMTPSTRFLVLGVSPGEASSANATTEHTVEHSSLIDRSKVLGVETIGVDEILALAGWRKTERVVSLRRDEVSRGFRAKDDAVDQFKPRRPPNGK